MDHATMPRDGGMLYTETNLGHVFPEPLNAITSLFFLALALYWFWRLKAEYKEHVYLTFSIVLLAIGAVGGSIYHGLRQWKIFIMMDWLPIMLLCVFTGVYFVAKLTRWYIASILVVGYGFFQYFIRQQIRNNDDVQVFINLNYGVLGLLVLLPVLAFLWRNKFENGKWVGLAWLAFVFALAFRILDKYALIAVGTHFLWHVFGAVAAYCMLEFVYLVNKTQADSQTIANGYKRQ